MVERIIAYYDGSNFYHLSMSNYGLKRFDFVLITKSLLRNTQQLVKLKYFNSPVNQQEDPEAYKDQQRFFAKIKNDPVIELYLGKLVTRNLHEVWVNCKVCGSCKAEDVNCPKCGRLLDLDDVKRTVEKGVDVKLAMTLLLDAINDKFDTAFLMSSDADFVPVIDYVINVLGKKVVYCHFPSPFTSDLVTACHKNTMLIRKETLEENAT